MVGRDDDGDIGDDPDVHVDDGDDGDDPDVHVDDGNDGGL